MSRLGLGLLQVALLVAAAPLCSAWCARLRAWFQRRQGAVLSRPYANLWKLFAKEDLRPPGSSPVFAAAPRVLFLGTCLAAAVLPVWQASALLQSPADFFLLAGGLALSRFALSLGAFDSGGAFAGMGASREALVATLAEGPLLLALTALALVTGHSSLSAIAAATQQQPLVPISPVRLLALASLAMIALAEAGRIPVDNPTTHLELTMIHEAMVLDYSGPSLAWIEWAASLRLLLLLTLIGNVFFPWGMAAGAGGLAAGWAVAAWAAKIALLATVVALVEACLAKLRMYAVPEYLGIAAALAALAVVFTALPWS